MEDNENKFFLIYAPQLNGEIEKEITAKVVSLGSRLKLDNGLFLLETEKNSKEIYEKLKFESFELKCLVLELNQERSFGYWDTNIWRFLKILKEKKND